MPQLAGDISFMPMKDLLLYVGNRRLTGQLKSRRGAREKTVGIVEGAAVSASSNDPREYLGQILINSGQLSEDDFEKAYRTQLETNVPLGRILTMIGLVKEEVVRFALLAKIRETTLDLCTWTAGEFVFEAAVVPEAGGVEVPLPVLDLCREADAREPIWAELRATFPSGKLRLEPVPGTVATFAPSSMEARLVALVDGRRTIDELLLHLHATDFQFFQLAHFLVRQGVLRVAGEGTQAPSGATAVMQPSHLSAAVAAAVPPLEAPARIVAVPAADEPSTWFFEEEAAPEAADTRTGPQLLAGARAALAAGRFDEAAELCAKAVEKDPSEDAVAALKEAEGGLLVRLRAELLAQPRIPQIAVDRNRVKTMPLSPPERYLLARMDGGRDLASIVRVSPLREVDALRLVKRFVEQGLVTLR